jgi:dUTP pyrophosphatase
MIDSITPAELKEAPLRASVYRLRSGPYVLTFAERIMIPASCCGLVLPRSSLLRSGVTIHTALWDPGYEGRGKVLLSVLNKRGAKLSLGARVAQLVVFQLSGRPRKTYSGQYQGEGL